MKNNKSMEEDILKSAEKLFLKRGFSLTSTTMIAKESGCNQALVHYYYRTKEKLFEAIFKKKMVIFVSSFMEIDDSDLSFEDKLKRKIEAHFDVLYQNQQLPFLIINELITNPARVASIKNEFEDKLSPVFGKFEAELKLEIQNGKIREVAAIDIILSIIALNVNFFLMKPVVKEALGMDEPAFNMFAEKRKEENVMTILNSLKGK